MRPASVLAKIVQELANEKPEIALAYLDREVSKEELWLMFRTTHAKNPKHPFVLVLEKAYALKDLFYFTSFILGYNKNRPAPDPNYPSVDMEPSLHGEMCEIVTSADERKRLFLVPRGHMKSTVLTIAHTIWLLCKNPNLRILIVSATGPTSEHFLAEIKQHFENNRTFRAMFPERLPGKGDVWNQDAIQVGGRTIQAGVNSVEARGLEGNIVGRHYDYCKADDLVTKDNITTAEQRLKVIEAFKALESVMEPYATWDIVGTRWHFYELYQWIIDQNEEAEKMGISPPFRLYIRRAVEENVPIFPAKFSYERLMQIKATQQDLYAKLYDNNPLPEEDREFKRSMFRFYAPEELEPFRRDLKHLVTTVDLAVTQKTYSDYSVVTTGAMHPDQNLGSIIVLDISRGKVTNDKVAQWVINHVDTYGSRVGYEAQGQQAMFEQVMNLVAEKERKYVRMTKLPGSANSNEARIRGLLPLCAKAPIWLPKDNQHVLQALDEFDRFPVAKHDDIAVTIAYLPALMRQNRRQSNEKASEYEPDNHITGY